MAWKEMYLIDVPVIDRQHRTLIELYDRFHEVLDSHDDRLIRETLPDVVGELRRYGRVHFSSEEQLMREVGYPGLVEQHDEHRTFLQRVAMLEETVRHDCLSVTAMQMINFLMNWIPNHILTKDRWIGTWLTTGRYDRQPA